MLTQKSNNKKYFKPKCSKYLKTQKLKLKNIKEYNKIYSLK